jgi:hypothetical protein
MRAIVVLVGLALALASAAACSSSSSSDDADGGPGFGSSSSGGVPVDGGGCEYVVGPRIGTVATVVDRGSGAVAWSNPQNALDDDGQFASVELAGGGESQELRVTGFGFSIPATATIKGVGVAMGRQAVGSVHDGALTLLVDGQTPLVKFYEPAWPRSALGVHDYGGLGETWNTTLTPADINKPSFGATLWVKADADGGTATANVDAMEVFVYYCP